MVEEVTEHLSLHRFSIEGLRGVGRVELDFQPEQRVYTLFGSNGIGKTKCLEVVYQLLLLSSRVFVRSFKGNMALESASLVADAMHCLDKVLVSRPKERAFMIDRFASHDLPVLLLGAQGRADLASSPSSPMLLGTFEQRREQFASRQADSFRQGHLLASAGMFSDVPSWFVTRAQSVNPYQKDADNRRVEIDAVLQMLHALDERIAPDKLQIDGGGRVFIEVSGQMRGLTELSSGFTSLVKVVQLIISGYAAFTNEVQLRHVRGVVLIDEIESHLHAQWQAQIIPKLKELLPNTTFFIATHSPLVLAQLQEGEAYLLKRDAEGVVRSEMIEAPNRRAFADVLESAFGVDLNALKRQALLADDQSAAKLALLAMLQQPHSFGEGA